MYPGNILADVSFPLCLGSSLSPGKCAAASHWIGAASAMYQEKRYTGRQSLLARLRLD